MTQMLVLVFSLIAAAILVVSGGVAIATYLLAAELRLFLQAPSFYVRKLFGPAAPDKRAKKIIQRIQHLLPAQTGYARDMKARVEKVPASLEALVRQRDRITLYLEYDVYGDGLGGEVGRQDPSAIDALERRRRELTDRIDQALNQLKRIETRVAAHALTARDEQLETATQVELGETLEELDLLISLEKEQGLLSQ